jgi:hypothetical protein
MPEYALLHADPVDASLLGVWIERGGPLESYYTAGESSSAFQYAEELVSDGTWAGQLERLPEASPYVARWGVIERRPGETAQQVFQRVSSADV